MLITGVTAAAFGTNCWVVAAGPGSDCLIVDPGFGVTGPLREMLVRERLRPAAVLLTHGHADHVWSVVPVCATADPPPAVHLHAGDRHRLRDPLAGLDPRLVGMLASQFPREATWQAPADVVAFTGDATTLMAAGLSVAVRHTPGHTEGSVVLGLDMDGDEPVLLSGDVLFAGSIGRTDLPGGDSTAMTASLREVMREYPDRTTVLPGHGATTTIGAERAGNPYVLAALAGAGRRAGRA